MKTLLRRLGLINDPTIPVVKWRDASVGMRTRFILAIAVGIAAAALVYRATSAIL